jgi:hypothetical protein
MKLLNSKISRRFVVAGTAASAVPVRAATTAQPRAAALIGDRAHNSDYIRISLDRVFHALSIPIDYTIDIAGLSAASLKPYQLLLIFRDGDNSVNGYSGADFYAGYEKNLENAGDFPGGKPVPWMSEEQGLAVKNFVTEGGGFYALHDASHISLSCKTYRDVMGALLSGIRPCAPSRCMPPRMPIPSRPEWKRSSSMTSSTLSITIRTHAISSWNRKPVTG